MIKLLDKFRIKTRLVILVVFSAIPLIILLIVSMISFNSINNNWDYYNDVVYKKNEYLNSMINEMGYGGFIHRYKNYIITGAQNEYERCKQEHNLISSLIISYKDLGDVSEEEENYLTTFQEGINVYRDKLDEIKRMHDAGFEIREINSAVYVNYTNYVYSLEILQDTLTKKAESEESKIKNTIKIAQIVILILTILIFLDVVISGFLISYSITRRINRFIDKFKMGMRGDLTIRMYSDDTKNEINILAKYFNRFMDLLSGIIEKVKLSINNTKDISSNLSTLSEESTSALTEINSNIEGMMNKTINLDKEINNSKESIKEVNRFISKVVDMINNQASAMSESSASIEQMSASIQNIAKVSENKLRTANQLEEKATLGEKEMQKTMEIINKVAESANVIVEMMDVINNIAGQTDLLAMNASIEAAHAGDSGKGFAVVADEIRNLAESTTENSKNISESLKKIIKDIKSSEESTSKTSSFFHSIVEDIRAVANGMSEMRNTNQELASGSNQVLTSLSSLVNVTDNVKSSSEEMKEDVSGVEVSITRISGISTDVKNDMKEVNKGTNELFIISKNVSEEGVNNMESIAELEEQISQIITDRETNHSQENNEKDQNHIEQTQKALPESSKE